MKRRAAVEKLGCVVWSLLGFVPILVLSHATGAEAEWPITPGNSLRVSFDGQAESPQVLRMDEAHYLIGWEVKNATQPLYKAQLVDRTGTLLWPSSGIVVAGSGLPEFAADEAGGALVAWTTRDASGSHLFAQRISPMGNLDWGEAGVEIASTTGWIRQYHLIGDSEGGGIFAWEQSTEGSWEIRLQRLDADGAPLWDASSKEFPSGGAAFTIASDGSGGAILGWRHGGINATRVSPDGSLPWGDTPLAVYTDFRWDQDPEVFGRAEGLYSLLALNPGRFAVVYRFMDESHGLANSELICQILEEGGTLGNRERMMTWSDRVTAAAGPGGQFTLVLKEPNYPSETWFAHFWEDATRGWTDTFCCFETLVATGGVPISLWSNEDIYALAVPPWAWEFEGPAAICTMPGKQLSPMGAGDGNGGAVIAWLDERSEGVDVYANRLYSSGLAGSNIKAEPAALDFGARAVGTGPSPPQSVVLSQNLMRTLFIRFAEDTPTVTGDDSGDFLIAADTGEVDLSVWAGESRTISVAFQPKTLGIKRALLRIHSNDQARPILDVPISGIGSVLEPTPTPTLAPRSDIDQNGRVDAEDLLLLLQDWKKVSGPQVNRE